MLNKLHYDNIVMIKKKITSNEVEKKGPIFFSAPKAKKRRANFFGLRRKMLRAQNRVSRCAQPASRRLLRTTGILTKYCARARAQQLINALVAMDTANVRPKRACRVMDLRSQAVPSL